MFPYSLLTTSKISTPIKPFLQAKPSSSGKRPSVSSTAPHHAVPEFALNASTRLFRVYYRGLNGLGCRVTSPRVAGCTSGT